MDINLIWPKYYSLISSMIVDDNDWIYVMTREKNRRGEIKYDVFDENLKFRGSFYHNDSIGLIKNNMAYAISEDAEGFFIIKRYEIKRK